MNHETAKGKRISVAREIDLLAGVIDCLKVTAKLQLEHPEEDPVTFARTTWRTLALLRERVKLMQWILRGSSSPLAALCTENEVMAMDDTSGDVAIPLWSSHHTLQRREQDLKKARARVEREQQEYERLTKPRLAMVPRPRTSDK